MTVYSPLFSNWLNLYWKMCKTVVQACKPLKSLSKKPWGSLKELFINLLLFFCLMREVKKRYICFWVYFWKFWLRQGGISCYGSYQGDEGADTDPMFQFCLLLWIVYVWEIGTFLAPDSWMTESANYNGLFCMLHSPHINVYKLRHNDFCMFSFQNGGRRCCFFTWYLKMP